MKKMESWELITSIGKKFQLNLKEIAKHNIKIKFQEYPLTTYSFSSRNTLKYKTYITQEMLKNGFLASTHFYSCIKHTDKFLQNTSMF